MSQFLHVGIWFNPFAIKLNKLANNNKEQVKGRREERKRQGRGRAGTGEGKGLQTLAHGHF